MPITKSAKKALRQSIKRHRQNLKKKNELKDIVKKIKKLASGKNTKEAEKLMSLAYKKLDKAAKIGLIKKNTASRKKSRLMKLLKKAGK